MGVATDLWEKQGSFIAPGAAPTVHTPFGIILLTLAPSVAGMVRLGAGPRPGPQDAREEAGALGSRVRLRCRGLLEPTWFHSPPRCGSWAGEGSGAGEGPSGHAGEKPSLPPARRQPAYPATLGGALSNSAQNSER